VPPQSIEAEQSVLGGLLLDNTAWDRVADVINETDFYRADHRTIFKHIAQLVEDNKPADALTVAEALELAGKLAEVGGQAYVGSLALNTPSAANIRRYAEIVRERSVMRSLAAIGTEIADSAYTPMGKDASVLIDEAEAKIFHIAEARSKARQGFVQIEPLLTETVERIDMLYSRENKNEVIGVATGFVDLDRMTSGLQPGELIVVAGRPSMGKTTLVMNMAEHVAIHEKKAVGVFSMEMSGPQLAMRMIGSVGRLDQHELRTGTFKEDDWGRVTEALGRLSEAQIHIDDTAGLNVLELRSRGASDASFPCIVAAAANSSLPHYRPGDWNEIEVTVKDGVAHSLCNGEVLEAAMKVPITGPIGVEGDRGQMEYRRIRIKED